MSLQFSNDCLSSKCTLWCFMDLNIFCRKRVLSCKWMKLGERGSHRTEHFLFPISFKQSVQHENSYRHPKVKYCYGDKPPDLQVIVSWHQGPVDVIPFVHWTLLFSRIVNLLRRKRIFFPFISFHFLTNGSDCQRTVEHCEGSVCIENKPCVAFPPAQLLVWWHEGWHQTGMTAEGSSSSSERRNRRCCVWQFLWSSPKNFFLSTCRHDTDAASGAVSCWLWYVKLQLWYCRCVLTLFCLSESSVNCPVTDSFTEAKHFWRFHHWNQTFGHSHRPLMLLYVIVHC